MQPPYYYLYDRCFKNTFNYYNASQLYLTPLVARYIIFKGSRMLGRAALQRKSHPVLLVDTFFMNHSILQKAQSKIGATKLPHIAAARPNVHEPFVSVTVQYIYNAVGFRSGNCHSFASHSTTKQTST